MSGAVDRKIFNFKNVDKNGDAISIGWWVFFLAGVLAIVIALVTISFQSIKAALANPVESLKSE